MENADTYHLDAHYLDLINLIVLDLKFVYLSSQIISRIVSTPVIIIPNSLGAMATKQKISQQHFVHCIRLI